jgi:hypothetical protein
VPIENSEIEKQLIQNFQEYKQNAENDNKEEQVPIDQAFFKAYTDIKSVNQKQGSDLFYSFLNKIFDQSEDDVAKHLPDYLRDLVRLNVIDGQGFSRGLSRFLVVLPNIAADYPHISKQLSSVMLVLRDENALSFREVNITDKREVKEDDDLNVEDYYRLFATFLILTGK